MVCPGCGVEVSDEQRFCNRCGTALTGDAAASATREPSEDPSDEPAGHPSDEPAGQQDGEPAEDPPGHEAPQNPWAAPTPAGAARPSEPVTTPPNPFDQPPTEQIETQPTAVVAPAWAEPHEAPTEPVDTVTEPVHTTTDGPASDAVTEPVAVTDDASATTTEPVRTTTAEIPAVFDGVDDLAEYPPPREPFRFRLVFLLSLFSLAAALMAFVADVIDIRTSRPTAGIDTGASTLDDLGTNLAMAGFVGAAAMVIGGLLACFGIRWGAGLAGGAALAVVGWAGLTIGLAEFPIAVAESITRTSPEAFTLTVTRDVGWLLVAGIGVLAVLVFAASLRLFGTGGHRALNPWISAVLAVAGVVLAFGPLVPVGDAVFADNFRSTDPNRDLPTAFFAGRLGQVALIAVAVVVGSLVVRAYGLGLATGAVTVATWMWVTSLTELGSRPIGIADRNPGAADTVPHAVTTVGMVATLVLLAAASVTALWQRRRRAR